MASVAATLLVCCVVWASTLAPVSSQDNFIKDCQTQKMDVVFVQDASFSVGAHNFQTAKHFITDIVRQLPVGPDLVRVALVRFGTYVVVIAKLSNSTDVSTVSGAIAGMEYESGGTQTGRALRTVREKVLNEKREDARAVVVVITDGTSINFRETRRESKRLRDRDVRLVWLYITANDTDSNAFGHEREFMIAQGDDTFGATSFQDLGQEDRMRILQASCKEDPVPETTTKDIPTTLPTTTAPPTTPPSTAPPTTTAPATTIPPTTPPSTAPPTTTAPGTTIPTTTPPSTAPPTTTPSTTTIPTTTPLTTTTPTTTTTTTTTLPTTITIPTTTIPTTTQAAPGLLHISTSPKPSPTSTAHSSVDVITESATSAASDGDMSSSLPPPPPPPDVSMVEAIPTESTFVLNTTVMAFTRMLQTENKAVLTRTQGHDTGTETPRTHTPTSTLSAKQQSTITTGTTSSSRDTTQEPSLSTEVTRKAPEEEDNNLHELDTGDTASKKGSSGDEEEEAFEDSWENIVGVVVGVFAVTALTSACVQLLLWRKKKRRNKQVQDP